MEADYQNVFPMKALMVLWNTETLAWEASTKGSGAGEAVSVENFPAVISGASVPVTGIFWPPSVIQSGTLESPGDAVAITNITGLTAIGIQITGTWTGQLEFEVSIDGTNFVSHDVVHNILHVGVNAATGNGVFFGTIAAYKDFRVRASALSSGAAVVVLRTSVGAESTHVEGPVNLTYEDPTVQYKITDIDPTEGNSYFGHVDKDGKWYIMNLTATAARYVKGDSGYQAAWGNKGALGYDYFYNVF
jgi:hypothetical protein